ncbi:S-formylglutathione hydrolase [Hahella sp. NBU794]|uniref:S-formylglutathione hydrolase n=1 Tax=Hahella sp. NBU794 TaxID=3422590 RepID=UPI003D6F8462
MHLIQENKCHGGYWRRYQHDSETCGCPMTFSVFVPAAAEEGKCATLFWLSGLTCTDQNFVQKADVESAAAEYGFIVVAPDTSPRNVGLDGEDLSYDFGSGAGFYVDATEAPWRANYRMYSYVTEELYSLVADNLPMDQERTGVFGHSMGGHGALTIALKQPEKFRSVSALAPICAPMSCPWGKKALAGYLGTNQEDWKAYDSVALIESGAKVSGILVDQGDKDEFLAEQLNPELLKAACAEKGIPLTLNYRAGYDHSYFFIKTFIRDHVKHHHKMLNDVNR